MMSAACEIFCCPLDAVDDVLLDAYRSLLNTDELQRLAGYRSKASAREFIVSRALLRTTLSQRLQCDARALVFERDEEGKPFIAFPVEQTLHFNISHERHWVALGVSPHGPIGIDAEGHERRNNLAAIAKRFFSAAENTALENCSEAQWRDLFFAIWTLKEAHAKALGCGLSKILACSSITPDFENAHINFELKGIARGEMPLAAWLYRVADGVSLAAVSHSPFAQNAPLIYRSIPLRSQERLSLAVVACGTWQPSYFKTRSGAHR